MSCVHLLCADHPLPLCAPQCDNGGFSVRPLTYYRTAVDDLEFSMKPCRYELELHAAAQDAYTYTDWAGAQYTNVYSREMTRDGDRILTEKVTSIDAVSYTHLDVYKRQQFTASIYSRTKLHN